MMARRPRVLLSAYQCAPEQGSVSQIGWEWYSRLARRAHVTLVTHVRNRAWLEAAGAPLFGSEVIYIDTEWFAGRLYRTARFLFPQSEHSVFLLSSLDYFVYDHAVVQQLRARASEWDIVHAVTPVSPSAHSGLGKLGLPFVRGPLNGGLRTPQNFPEFMRADSAWLYSLRGAIQPFRRILGKTPDATLTANLATRQALPPEERGSSVRVPEIAVDPALFPSTPWPAYPSATQPLEILFVGRLIPAKALPLLFEAVRRLGPDQSARITVIGDGPMRAAWEKDAKARGIGVSFVGARGRAGIIEALSRSHVFCLPSVRESGGAVLLEAMSAARPVVAIDYGGPAELVTEHVGRLVPAANPETVIAGIEAAFRDLLKNPTDWQQRGLEGRRYVLRAHTWDRRIEAGMAVYSTLLHNESMKEAA